MTSAAGAQTRLARAWLELRWRLGILISRFGFWVGPFFPARFWYRLADPIADFCFILLRRHRRNLIANLTRLVGEEAAEAAARRTFRNFGRYVVDLYQLPSLGRQVLEERIDFSDWATLDKTLDDSPGTIFVTLHLGQVELGGAALSTYGHPISVIAENLEYGPLNDFVQGVRESLGMKIIPAKKSKLGILRALNRGEVVATMFDVVEEGEGICVDFFGRPALVSSAPARLALKSGARVLPAVVARDPSDDTRLVPKIDFGLRYEVSGDEAEDVRRLTQAIATSLQQFIVQYPDQWFAFRPVWNDESPEPPSRRTRRWMQLALALAARVGGRLPRPLAYGLARLGADIAYRLRRRAREDVQDNMRHVLGSRADQATVERHAREVFRNVARYYVDLIRLPESTDVFQRRVRLHGFDRLTGHLSEGRGVVVATAHFGNPEIAVQMGTILGLNILVLVEPLQPPSFARLMTEIRSAYGAKYIEVGFSAVAKAIRHLRSGGCLAITCDRDIQGKGVPLTFFGEMTRLPLGAADLAARTGALLMPGFCSRTGDSFDIYFEEPMDLVKTSDAEADSRANAQALLARAEEWIARDPGQWLPLERIWKPLAQAEAEEPRAEAVTT